jgi:hypothetical protein
MVFIFVAILIGIGIWLTGYRNVHWFLYLPPAALLFAGITGFCPSFMIFRKLGFRDQEHGNRI